MLKFDSLTEFLDFLPGEERILVEDLRNIILECIPNVTERISYNVPYYFGNRRICFIWPSSIPWGNVEANGVKLGFCYGELIENDLLYLDKEGRKSVLTKSFLTTEDINEELLRRYLFQAYEIDRRTDIR